MTRNFSVGKNLSVVGDRVVKQFHGARYWQIRSKTQELRRNVSDQPVFTPAGHVSARGERPSHAVMTGL